MSDDGNDDNDIKKWILLALAVIGAIVVASALLPVLWSVAVFLFKALLVVVVLYAIYRMVRGFFGESSETSQAADPHLLEAEDELDELTDMEHDRELAEFKAKLDADERRD